jgi:lysophospholipid acyltransferase (LPLAT)-like uncharacterized protein
VIQTVSALCGSLIGRYSRKIINETSVRRLFEAPLPPSPVVWVGWHELNLITVALHRLVRSRPAYAFMPTGAKGAAVKEWIGEFDITPVQVSGDAFDGLALRRMRKALRNGFDVITAVDGPAGPRRQVKPGALWLSASAGVPIMPVGCAASPSFRYPRWDRHLVPLPGARIVAAFGRPIEPILDPKSQAAADLLSGVLDTLMERAANVLRHGGDAAAGQPPGAAAEWR